MRRNAPENQLCVRNWQSGVGPLMAQLGPTIPAKAGQLSRVKQSKMG
jgi:hypothetical protein